MRKVVYSMIVSLDGYVAKPDGNFDELAPDEEVHRFFNEQARQTDVFLYGRRMYELMEYWRTYPTDAPSAPHTVEFAEIWRQKPKVVFSRTLRRVEHEDVTLVRDRIDEYIVKLKAQPAGTLAVGGPTLAASLIRYGLVDEYRPVFQPVLLGGGKPYFPALHEIQPLRLAESRTFRSGAVYASYQR